MKKVLSVLLSILLLMTCTVSIASAEKTLTPAPGRAEYDAAKVAAGEVSDLTYEQIATILLDWLDRKIAAEAAGFNDFGNALNETEGNPIDFEVTGINDIVKYYDHLEHIGGDFAKLVDADQIGSRDDGDVQFIYNLIAFMAKNADVLGKIFSWEEGQTFDFGFIGQYIEGLEEDDEIRVFYENYLIGGNIQEKFISEIAREMGYTVKEGETFDEVINNGVKAKVLEVAGELLSEESKAEVNAYDLRTTDIYTLVKDFLGLVQKDNKETLDTVLSEVLEAVRTALKTVLEVTENINMEPPVVEIGDADGAVGTYHPANTNVEAYMPVVYTSTQYKNVMETALGTDSPVTVTDEALRAAVSALISAGNGKEMNEKFVMTVKQGEEVKQNIEISFTQIEEMIKAAAKSAAAGMGMTAEPTVTMAYTSYVTDAAFVTEVKVTSVKVGSFDVLPLIGSMITNPVATVVVDNLSGEIEGLEAIAELLDFVNVDFVYSEDLLDFAKYYDAYKGVVGQMNRVLCDALKMVLTENGYASLNLTEGGNENLTANIEKLRAKANEMLGQVKDVMGNETLAQFLPADLDLDLGMLNTLDFSSVEALYVSVINTAAPFVPADSALKELVDRVQGLQTLDAMAVAAADLVLSKALADVELEGWTYTYASMDYENVAEDGAKDVILDKVVDLLYNCAVYATNLINTKANEAMKALNEKTALNIGTVKFVLGVEQGANWEETLNSLINRFVDLTDGLLIESGKVNKADAALTKANQLLNAVLPMSSMLSGTTDVEKIVNTYIFTEALDGSFDHLLSLFEVKEDEIAGNTPVTKALINASQYIVDAFFPGTVVADTYTASLTVQDAFTSSANDAVIAANNMRSINERKTHIVPAVLDLIRESGLLPSFACDHTETVDVEAVAPTCVREGNTAGKRCVTCGTLVEGEVLPADPENHAGPTEKLEGKAATCTEKGLTEGEKCAACGVVTKAQNEVPALSHDYTVKLSTVAPTCTAEGYTTYKCTRCDATERRDVTGRVDHVDNDGDGYCDFGCGTKMGGSGNSGRDGITGFWQRIVSFFQRIIDFFRNLFN